MQGVFYFKKVKGGDKMAEEIVIKIDGDFSGYEETLNIIDEKLIVLSQHIATLTGEIVNQISIQLTQEVLPELITKIGELNLVVGDGTETTDLATGSVAAFKSVVSALEFATFITDIVNLVKGLKEFEVAAKAGAAAQQLLNIAQKAMPAALLVSSLAAIIVLSKTYKTAEEEIVEAHYSEMESIKKLSESHYEAVNTIDKKANAEIAEAENVLFLRNRLYELEKQIKSGTITDEEAEKAKDAFAVTAAQLENIIPGISNLIYDETGQINIQKGAVNDLTDSYYELAVAKSLASAAEEKMNDVSSKLVDARIKQKEKKEQFIEQQRKVNNFDPNTVTYTILGQEYSHETPYAYDGAPQSYIDSYNVAKKEFDFATDEVTELENLYLEYYDIAKEENQKIKGLMNKLGIKDKSNTSNYFSNSSIQTNFVSDSAKQARDELDYIYKLGEISTDEYYKRIAVIRDTYLAEGSEEWKKYTLELIEYEQEKIKEGLENELAIIDEAHKNGELSDAEYYKALQAYRDKYFTEGCENWDKYTDEIFKINEECIASQKEAIRGVFEDITKYADDSINAVLEKRNALEDKLKGEGGFFKKVTINDGEETLFTFGDTDEYKKTSEEFTNALVEAEKRLKDTGLMNEEQITAVMDEMMSMSAKEGTTAANSIIRASDMELNSAVKDFLAWYEATEKGAADVYQDEYEDTVDKISEYMTEAFSTAGLEIPEGFFDIGSVSADNFASAFKEKLDLQLKDVLAGIDGIVQPSYGTEAEGTVIDSTSEAVTAEAAQETGMRTEANGEYIEAVDENVEYMKEEFSKAGLEIPDGFFDTGIASAQRFGEAFKEELNRQFDEIRRRVMEFNQSLVINTGSGSVNGIKLDSSGLGTTVNQTFNVGSEKETSRQQIENWRNAQEFSVRAGV